MPSISSIMIGITVALGIALGVVGWQLKASLKAEAVAVHARDIAIAANKTNLATIDRLEADQVIAQAVAIADAQAHAKAENERDELVAAANAAGACGALDALIERRRQQIEGRKP